MLEHWSGLCPLCWLAEEGSTPRRERLALGPRQAENGDNRYDLCARCRSGQSLGHSALEAGEGDTLDEVPLSGEEHHHDGQQYQ